MVVKKSDLLKLVISPEEEEELEKLEKYIYTDLTSRKKWGPQCVSVPIDKIPTENVQHGIRLKYIESGWSSVVFYATQTPNGSIFCIDIMF